MSTKTTLKHQTKTGEIKTRKTEREYTHVVVRRITVEETGRIRAGAIRSIERIEENRAYAKAHADEATEHRGILYVRRGYELFRLDDAHYDKWIAKEQKRLAEAEALCETDTVVSWHGSAMLAAKAADKIIASGERGVYVEAINGGERD
jgi:hypothetical protein